MLLEKLREEVLEANLELLRHGLVLYTFGNASGIDREQGLVVIKPSGVAYDEMKLEHMVVTDLEGKIVEGTLRPSSDLDTHTLLYREFSEIGGVVHTHSEFATSFAQAGLPVPALGTTHADYFYGPVPVTLPLSDEAIGGRYVHETGLAIVARFKGESGSEAIDPRAVPACLVAGHAPFVWGKTPHDAAHNAVVLEAVARMAYRTISLEANSAEVSQALLDRHYFRKHGKDATYGQG
ncbi:L-ribulose-5-phosphate 4-epimerase [Tunturiibacter gelidoferens]|jgi:L-ribulose-5-phosphate 4-epimerase|uniref:L-ribulose-5-phosphate 4-epimerase n=1 Tax=Tunturiibacter gelidiferens TaxID=3069689 RepID=A0A9X0U4G4_9BACT|nr:L-ribulose-5-phosphate 4-epimerase [Edaphobacter lichenicola]MBB5329364.1 L-ribulose-5-phosphate 4-epimerase [Edaphobacter lichenicola]